MCTVIILIRPSRDGPYYVIGYGRRWAAGGCPHRFRKNFSSVYRIFTKLGHMIPPWKGKYPVYFGVIMVKGQGHRYYKYNFWQQDSFRTITLVLHIRTLPNLATWFPCGRGRTLFILGLLPLYRLVIYIDGRILWCTHFLLFKMFQCRTINKFLKTEHSPWPKPRVTLSSSLNFNSYMYVLLSIASGQCLMSFLLSVTFFSGVYSVTLYFHGFNLKFSCVNNL